MSRVARTTTAVVLAALVVGGGTVVYRAVRPARHGGHFRSYAYFRDANGLPVGSRVKIAGIVVGTIDGLTIENGQARVDLILDDDVVLWDDAWIEKKAASPLADNYVEISPGGPEPDQPVDEHRRLRSGEPIPRVLETATTDKVLRGLERSIPRSLDRVIAVDRMTDEARQWVAGPLSERLARLDRQLNAGALAAPLTTAAARTAAFDEAVGRAADQVHAAVPVVDRGLDELVASTAAARQRLAALRADVADGLAAARDGLDQIDGYAATARSLLDELAPGEAERQGRLARLIDDPATADELEDTTAELAVAARDLDRLKALIGLRAEWNLIAGAPRFVVSTELGTGRDSFYLIEIEKGPWGGVPDTQLTAGADGTFTRTSRIAERSRFTAQWGRRFGPLSIRAGLKESMFGVGADAVLVGGRLRLSVDAMESNFSTIPRLKLIAALQVFRAAYVVGGVDDALNPGHDLAIAPGAANPQTLSRLHYGRDAVLGFDLRFTDADVTALLRLYGTFLATLL